MRREKGEKAKRGKGERKPEAASLVAPSLYRPVS
jgi:hypothetical protein